VSFSDLGYGHGGVTSEGCCVIPTERLYL